MDVTGQWHILASPVDQKAIHLSESGHLFSLVAFSKWRIEVRFSRGRIRLRSIYLVQSVFLLWLQQRAQPIHNLWWLKCIGNRIYKHTSADDSICAVTKETSLLCFWLQKNNQQYYFRKVSCQFSVLWCFSLTQTRRLDNNLRSFILAVSSYWKHPGTITRYVHNVRKKHPVLSDRQCWQKYSRGTHTHTHTHAYTYTYSHTKHGTSQDGSN